MASLELSGLAQRSTVEACWIAGTDVVPIWRMTKVQLRAQAHRERYPER